MDLTFAIELKGDGTAIPTADLIKKFSIVDKVVVTSFKYKELKDIKAYAPEFTAGYLTEKVDESLLEMMKKDNIEELCPEAKLITTELMKEWRALGFSVRAWGVYNEEIMKTAFDLGVDGMTVNFPDKLTKYISERK